MPRSPPDIIPATKRFEAWLGQSEGAQLVRADLRRKHQVMADSLFDFLRSTFYRWAALFPQVCPKLAKAPRLLCVGDLHAENFGTWRDAEGRLVWGVNDFDEAFNLPYANDLVRLATSLLLAIESEALPLKPAQACELLLLGYHENLDRARRQDAWPFVLAQAHSWLADLANQRDTKLYWATLQNKLGQPVANPPADVRKLLDAARPAGTEHWTIHRRVSGRGSLGKPRFCALGWWRGGIIAREAKRLTPSACAFLAGRETAPSLGPKLWSSAVRAHDPFLSVHGAWIIRRLAPDCGKIELAEVKSVRSLRRLVEAMGQETANIHAASPRRLDAVAADLQRRKPSWLQDAAHRMADITRAEWTAWRNHFGA